MFVGAINAMALQGGQITRFHEPPHRAKNGNLGNFEAVDRNGTVFAPKQCLYTKVATGMENLKMQSLCWCYNLQGFMGQQITRFHAPPYIGLGMEIWETSRLSIAMAPCLQQRNVYMKR